MEIHRHRLLIGACGWEHPTWVGTFYPEDLPEDWRLSFYGNEFRLALIPGEYWGRGAQGPGQWLEACDDDFLFLTEVPEDIIRRSLHEPERADELLAWQQASVRLGRQCLGTLMHVPDDVGNEHALEGMLNLLGPAPPICLDATGRVGRDVAAALAHRLDLGLVWDGEGATPEFGEGELAVTRLRRAPADLRELRRVVEGACALGEPHRTAVLVIDTDSPDTELMRQAEVIANLL